MLPKNTFRQRRLDRLKVFPGEAPDVYLENVVKTWRDGSVVGRGGGVEVPVEMRQGVQAEVGGR